MIDFILTGLLFAGIFTLGFWLGMGARERHDRI